MKKWGLIFLTQGQTLPTDFYLLTSRLGNALHYWGSSQGCAGEVSLQAEGKQSHRREVSPVEIWTYISSVSLLSLSHTRTHKWYIWAACVCRFPTDENGKVKEGSWSKILLKCWLEFAEQWITGRLYFSLCMCVCPFLFFYLCDNHFSLSMDIISHSQQIFKE